LINDPEEFAVAHRTAMKNILNGPLPHDEMPRLTNNTLLKLEMAVTVDCGRCLYDFIYQWEGDGLVSPYIYYAMKNVTETISLIITQKVNCPNVVAVARDATNNVLGDTELYTEFACSKAQKVLDKWKSIFELPSGKLYNIMQIYRCLQLLDPSKIRVLPYATIVEMIKTLCNLVPILRGKSEALLLQLPQYLASMPEVTGNEGSDFENCKNGTLLAWWKNNTGLTDWLVVLTVAVLLQPSSCTAERVFSMYTWMFGDDQDSALEDYKETALMLRFNEQDRLREMLGL
jgi:hypothetical protein